MNNKKAINVYLSKITLYNNELKALFKIHRVAEWIKKQNHLYAVYERPCSYQKTNTDRK